MSEEIEKIEEQPKRRRKNRVVTEIIDTEVQNEQLIAKLREEITKQVLEEISKKEEAKESKKIFEPTTKRTKDIVVNRVVSVPKGKSRIRTINIQMPKISKFKQFRRGKNSKIATTFYIQSR